MMKHISKLVLGTALCAGIGYATHGPDVGLHPGYTLMTLRPTGFEPAVAGMDFLPNGDMLILTWRGTSGPSAKDPVTGMLMTGTRTGTPKLYRVTNTKGNDQTAIAVTEVATGFKDAQGLCVVNGTVYVGDIDRIVKLVDKDGNGKYEDMVEIGKIPSYSGWFEYSFGPVHKDGKLYMALAGNVMGSGSPTMQFGKDRSCVISMPIGGGAYTVVAEGLRAPDGIAIGPDGEIFVTDNQGGWRPSSQFHHIVQGRFYGYMTEPAGPIQIATGAKVTLPAIWTPHAEANESPTEPNLMKTGTYAGQFIYGDIGRGGIYRAFLEKVGGEYQGSVVDFSGGLEVGVHRIRTGANGEVYVGGLGNGGHSNQGWNETKFGLQKLTPNGSATFEILATRSRAAGMELEFTMPVGTAGEDVANYTVQQWWYKPTIDYGGPKQEVQTRIVKSVKLSPDRKRVFLEIDGLKTGQVVYILTKNLMSQDNNALWYPKTWYTLNAISTSLPFEVPSELKAEAGPINNFLTVEQLAGKLKVGLPNGVGFRVDLVDFQGRIVSGRDGVSNSAEFPTSALQPGVYFLRAVGGGMTLTRSICF